MVLLRRGLTNGEIADRLGISRDGVKYHISNMLGKLQLGDRDELARWKYEGEETMKFKSHQYRGARDLQRMVDLISASRMASGPKTCQTIGGIYYYVAATTPSPDRVNPNIRIWTDENSQPAGYVWFDPIYSSLQLHPDHRGSGVEVNMLQWMEDRFDEAAKGKEPTRPLLGHAFDTDPAAHDLLRSRGYAPNQDGLRHLWMSLKEGLESELPGNVQVRSVQRSEIVKLSAPYEESHLKLLEYGAYDAGLDLVAVLEDGSYGGHYICWLDNENRTGELHQVKTSESRGGTERAIVLEALRRMKARGADQAVAFASATAVALYESCGFETVATDSGYWHWKGHSAA